MKPKQLLLCLVLLTIAVGIWCATINEILQSPDVIAYREADSLFIMDVNTGKEVALGNEHPARNMVWSKNGQSIYYIDVAEVEYEENSYNLNLYEKVLSTGKETFLGTQKFAGYYLLDIQLFRGIGDTLYVNGMQNEPAYITTDDGTEIETDHNVPYAIGSFDLVTGKWKAAVARPDHLPKAYINKKAVPIIKEGSGIVNKAVKGLSAGNEEMNHYELFINRAQAGAAANYEQLTYFDKIDDYHYLHNQKIPFSLSPDHRKVLYSYYYKISDPNDYFAITNVTSVDGQHKQELYDTWALDIPYFYDWTNDSRLIFIQSFTEPVWYNTINILDANWNLITLKKVGEALPTIYYRR